MDARKAKLRMPGMVAGLVLGVGAVVVVACAAGAYIYSRHHFESLLQTARSTARAQGELVRVALEHQMIENDRSLIARMIESFGREPNVERVVVLDRNGQKRFAGGRSELEELSVDSPTCQACHQFPPEQRGNSRVIETMGGTMLRTVIPIHNRAACHKCHDPKIRLNGILLLDYDAGEIHAAMSKDLRWMFFTSSAIAFLLVGAIALVFRAAILKRLQRFETAARQIAEGDLDKRVPAGGSDIVSWLAREFNSMADSMSRLVGEVRTQRERLETVINSIDDGIVVLDAEHNVLAANDAFLQRVGRSREQPLFQCCRNMPAGGCSVRDCPAEACLDRGGRQVRICERAAGNGRVAWEEVHASPIRDSEGNLTQVVEVWRDISDRREAEARLADSHRLASLGMLASGFSHELNTPLATVLMCVESILRQTNGERSREDLAPIRESASIAREQVLRCRGTTQHFLRLSRGHGTSGVVVDVRSSIAAVIRLVEPTARAHSVQVEFTPPPESIPVRVDEADLQHAMVNLLLNAIQASNPGGRVTASAAQGGDVRIRVADHGCGIAAEHLNRIFEPFFSIGKRGTGLGLFLSMNFIRRWGGGIHVESAPGAGSTFEISLPSVNDSKEAGFDDETIHIDPARR